MKKLHRGRLLLSTCLTGIALASASGAQAQDSDPNWRPRAEVDARAADGSSQVSMELFTPVAQNDSNLMFVTGRIGYDERFDRNGSVTIGGRGKVGGDVAIGVNAGIDFYKSDFSKRDQTAVSFGLEGFTSTFDVRLNYRLPVTNRHTVGYLDPNASPVGMLLVENNRLIERKSGWRLEDVPLGGANAEIGATAPLGKQLSLRASVAGFDYRDDHASKAYRGVRGGLELGVEDPLGSGGRFSIGAELQNDNRWGTQARGTLRLSIPLGHGSRDRSAGASGLDRQMGDRIRRDYVTPAGSRFTDLTSDSFAIDARTGNEFGGIYYVNAAAAAAGAGTSASPTTLADAVTRAGANGVVVAMGNAGNITTGGVTLATNQYLVGGASSVDVRHSNGTVSAFSFGSSNGTIVGSNAGGAAVTLGQGSIVRDVTVRGSGSGILANGVGGFGLQRVIIENTGAAGLTLTNTTGTVVIDGITIRGAAGAGLIVNGGSGLVLRNSVIGGGAGAIDINDAGGNLTASLSNLSLSATGGTVLDVDGSGAGTVMISGLSGIFVAGGNGETGGFAARNVTFDSSTASGIQAVNAGTMQLGTATARVNGAGVTLTEVDGALSFGSLNIANNDGTGLTVNNTKTGTFALTSAAGAVDTITGTALHLDPLLINLNFASVSSTGAAGAGLILDNVQGAGTGGSALNIGTLTIANSGQQGLFITGGSTGLVTIGGGTITNSGGAAVQVGDAGVAGSGGTIGLNFGATITDGGAGPLASIFNAGGALRFTGAIRGTGPITIDGTAAGSSIVFAGDTSINGSTGNALSINNVAGTVGFTGTLDIVSPAGSGIVISNSAAGSTVAFTGATTITGAGSPALSLDNLAGATVFSGPLGIVNPAGTAIVIGAAPGGVTFGDVDITGLGAATGLDLTGTSGNVTFGTLDITGTGAAGSTGIDLTNAANAGAVTIANPSVIQGVDIGANLTNAHITGSFRYGDGNAADGLESRITANTVIAVLGLNATQGTYDFADVDLDGDTNNITGGSFTTYYVLAGATGTGTALDPGSIAGAAVSGAQYIVLLNDPNGGRDVIDTAGLTGGALSLIAGQSLVSFLNTDFFAVTGATVPANLIVSNLGPTGIANTFAGSGAAILTSTLGASTVNLANDTRIDGVVIDNDALGIGITGSGVSNVIIRNSIISGTGGAIGINDGGAAASVTLTNLDLSASGGRVLALSGAGAGTLNVSGTGINIAATGAASAVGLTDVTVGTLDIGSVTTEFPISNAVMFNQVVGGTVNVGSVTTFGTTSPTGSALAVVNSGATVNIGAVDITNTAGTAVTILNNSGNVTLGSVSVINSAGSAAGVNISGNTGNVTLGPVLVDSGAADGVRLNGNGGTVSLGQLTVRNVAGAGLRVAGATGATTVAGAAINFANNGVVIANVSGSLSIGNTEIRNNAGTGIQISGVTGSASFTGATTISGSNGIVLGAGSTGTISFGDTDITDLGAGKTGLNARAASGTVSFATLDISGASTSGTRGIDMTGATFAGSITVADSSSITGVGTGVDLTNAAITGSFRYGDGSNTDADGANSTINAITPITVTGINEAVGNYNFADVVLNGDTTGLVTNPVRLFFVEQGRTGAGTKTDPGSLAAALASNATVIVLLNNPTGGSDALDVAGLGTFALDANQRLIGFLNGDSQNVGGGTPVNMVLYGLTPSIITNPYAGSGAGLLTNTGGGATVTLANGASIDGIRIDGTGIGVSGTGVSNVAISNSIISGGNGAILLRDGGVAASATLTNLALAGTGGTVLDLLGTSGGMLSLSGSGISITATGNARGLAMGSVTLGGDLGFDAVSTLTSGGVGVSLNDVRGAGTLSFASIDVGGTMSQSGVRVTGNSAAIDLGNVTVANTATHGIEIDSNTGNVTLGTFDISNTGMIGLLVSGMPGTFTAAGGTVTNSGTMGLAIGDIDGSVSFTGGVTIANPGTTGITFGMGSSGTINFADVDITDLAAGKTGLDARIATGNIAFGTLDITGASAAGARGIDLTGATFGGSLIVAGSSTITGVGTGIDLTNAAITGDFRFGDGSNTDANGAASTINATIPLVVAGLNSAVGTYNFADVNLVGDTSALATSATVYWVLAGASGAGTRGDPGSLTGAAASGADIVVLLNNPIGGNDTLDVNDAVSGTGGTFTLMTGQQLRGFLYGDVIALPGGAPANVTLYNVATGSVTNPFTGSGAPTLTTTAGGGAHTVVVGNNTLIEGVVIANGGTGAGVFGSGKSNVTIRNSNISGANRAIDFSDNGVAASIALSNLRLWASNNSIALAAYQSGGGSTTITQLSDIVIEGGHGEAVGAHLVNATFDADLATASYETVNASLTIGSTGARVNGLGLSLVGATGALNFTNLDIYNQGATGLSAGIGSLALSSTAGTLDTVNGTTLVLNAAQTDLVFDSIVRSGAGAGAGVNVIGGLTGIGAGGRALQVGTLNVASASTNGILIAGNVNGLIGFGAGSSITGTTGSAISIDSGIGTLGFTYDGSVSQSSNAALLDVVGHNGTITFGAASNLSATNGTGLQFDNADGTYAFNGTTTLIGGDAGIDILNGSAGSFTFANASISSPTGAAINIADSMASLSYAGNVTQANNAALFSVLNHSAGTISFLGGTLSATNGTGLRFSNADGTYNFNGGTTLNGGSASIGILAGSAGSFSFGSGTTITNPSGPAFNLASSTADVTYLGTVNQSTAAVPALAVSTHSAGTLDFSDAALNVTSGFGLAFNNANGSYSFGNATLDGGAGILIIGSAGNFAFGSGTSVTNAAGAAISIANSSAGVTYSGVISQSTPGVAAIEVSAHSTGALNFTGATVAATGGNGLAFNDADGSYSFGNLALSGGARLALLNGSAGSFTFGDVDITGLAANTTAVNLTGAAGNVSFNTLDIAAASAIGTRGIDMTGSTTAGNVTVNRSSTMTGLGIGVNLANAAITGNFRYGDGSNTDANGAASSIAAVTPLVITGLNGGTGNYNFADVNMVGDTTNLSVSAYFVLEGATGIGTRGDPGSLVGAEAANATYIVLLNDPTGGNDILDATAGAGGSFDLDGGQILYSFRDTDSFTVGGGAPANVVLYNVQTGVISNPFVGSGAPTLTASGANATLTLGGNNIIDGVIIANSGTGAGILGNGAGGTLTIRNSTISGGGAGALRIYDNAANVVLGLSNLTLAANGGNILHLDGTGAGTFTLTQLTDLTVNHTTETGGFVFADLTFDSDTLAAGLQDVNAGALTIGTPGARITGDGLSLTNVTGTLNFSNLDIANNGGTGLIVANSKANNFTLGTTGGAIDTTNGTAINLDPLSIDMTLNSVSASGGAYGILLDQVLGDFTVTGAVNVSGATGAGIAVRDNTALSLQFQGAVAINNTAGTGVLLTNNTGVTVDFIGGLGIVTITGTGFATSGGGTISVTGSGNTITAGSGNALALNGVTVANGGVTFDQITAASSLGAAVSAVNINLAGALNFAGLDLDAVNAAVVFNNLTGTGGINLTGTLDIDSGTGFTFAGSLGTINIANTAGSSLTIDGGQQAIRFVNATGGIVNVASAAGSAAIDGSVSSAIDFNGDTGGTLNYGGTINVAQGGVLNAANSLANVTLSGAITSTTASTAFNFANAEGIYTISGNVSHTGGAGVAIDAASAGGIFFSGTSKTFNTGANAAITTAGTGALSINGGGLGITTTTGAGFTASGGGTVVVAGANNRIDTVSGQILSLNDTTIGSGGIDFASLTAIGSGANHGIFLNDVVGNAFNGGTVNIAGISGITSDGIRVSGGTAAITFGATTIGTAGSNAIELLNSGSNVTFGSVNLAGGLNGAALSIVNATNAVTISGGNIASTSPFVATLVDGGTGNITIGADINGSVSVTDHEIGIVTFSGNVTAPVGSIHIANSNSGTFNFTGQSLELGAILLSNNAGAVIDFNPTAGGSGLDIVTPGTGFSATSGGTINVAGAGNSISTSGAGSALNLQGVTIGLGGFTFDSVSVNGATTGIALNGLATTGAALSLGTVNLQGITSRGIDITGTNQVGISITDLDIALNSNSAIALDLNGATLSAPIIIGDFDVTNAGGTGTSIAVDLRGTLGGASILLGGQSGAASSIAGVGTGIYLDAATNALVTYGDGEAGSDIASTISASTAIDATAAPGGGTYDFRDVAFAGSPGAGFGVNKIWFVDADGSTGGGNGSGSDGNNPMTIAAAAAIAGIQDIIVLVNNGQAISTGGSSLLLATGAQVRGFGDGAGGGAGNGSAPVSLTITVPSTILLASGTTINIADPTGLGAATLTSSAGTNSVVTLAATGNRLSGFILDGTGGVARGVYDGGSGTASALLDRLTIRNFAGVGGVDLASLTGSTIDRIAFSANARDLLLNSGSSSTFSNITSTGALSNALNFETVAGLALTNISVSGAGGRGIQFSGTTGTVTATNVDVSNTSGPAIYISGGSANYDFDATSSVSQGLNNSALSVFNAHTGTFTHAGTINAVNGIGLQFDNADGTYNFIGAVTLNGGDAGIDILNGSAGTFTFGTGTSIMSPSGTAFNVSNSTAAVAYNGGIAQANNAALVSILNHSGGTITFQIGTLGATNGNGLRFDNADGTYSFTGTTTLGGGDAGIDIFNGSSGTFGFGTGISIVHAGAGDAFVLTDSDANVSYSGNITDNAGYAVRIDNHDAGTITFQTGNIGANGAGALGIGVANSNGGAVAFNGEVALNTGTNAAVTLNGNAGSTVTFNAAGNGLDIVTTSGTGFLASGGGTINVLGANNSITSASGTLLNASNAAAGAMALNLNFASASNTSGADGILIDRTAGTLTGSVNIAGGAITATNRGVNLDGDALTFTYGGSITTSGATARSVEVTGRTANTATFSGNITDTALGINIANNTGGTVSFTGPSISLATVADATALTLASNTGASILFEPAAGGNGLDIVASGTGTAISFTGGGTLDILGSGNTVQTVAGQILNLVNGNVGAAGLTFASLTSTGTVAATAVNVSNLDGGTLNGGTVSIAGTGGAGSDGIFYGGGSTTNLNFGSVTIANTADEGIEISGANNGLFTAGNVAINNTGGNGVEINGATNSVTLAGGAIGAIDDPTGFGVYVLNGTGAVNVAASITKTTVGNVVLVDNHESGLVNFSGNISGTGGVNSGIVVQNVNSGTVQFGGTLTLNTGASTAVNLLNNTGGTISFPNGGLGITTTSGTGFSATGGGNVDVRGTNSTINSGTGTALNIVNTNIGANGVNFRSISSNGAASGIILSNTGAASGLRVVGTGTAGSGGTIQNATGDGISLTSTESVRLAYMSVTNNRGDGIGGSNVNGFVIDNLLISGNGNDNGADESGINLANLTGGSSGSARPTGIFNSTIQNNNEFEVQITNSTGTLTNFQIVNSNISSNGAAVNGNATPAHGNLVNFLGTGTSLMGLTVTGSTFTGNWNPANPPAVITGSGLFIDSSGTSMTANVSTSNFYNNNNGINVSTGPGSTTLTYSIIGNTIAGSRSTAINDFHNGNSPFTRAVYGTIQNNIIGTNGVALSGSQLGNGISISNEGAINASYLISGNTIQQIGQAAVSGSSAIAVNVGLVGQATGGGTTNVTITNNIIRDILNSRGIVVSNNQNTGTLPTIRLSLSGNQFLGTIAGQAGNGQYIRLSASGGGQFFLTQAAATGGAIANELDDANGFNDPTKISIGAGGPITYGAAAPSPPPAVVPLP